MSNHKTSHGDDIDMDSLRLKNEKVRAVGNMNVNARGDVLDSNNNTSASRSKQVNRQYKKQTSGEARDMPVMSSKAAAEKQLKEEAVLGLDEHNIVHTASNKDIDAVIEKVEEKVSTGLAGAIAKAKEIKQEPLKTAREEERSGSGVKKI